ncbi:MAG: DUF5106 domain-containing protein [Muribaculaceae bacterium]|nr:DUF5106 domain-containing protein [Muribaculaceae bacterium]
MFKYPEVPSEKVLLSERCNYLVYHFWDKANLTTAFSAKQKLNSTLGDWFNLMPYATADTVHIAIDALISKVEKNGKNLQTLAEMAEGWLYSDTADIHSEEIYLPFAKAAAENKKIDKASRARFASQVQVMETSAVGATLPESLSFTDSKGARRKFSDIEGRSILLCFLDPMCQDCALGMVRLAADPHLRDLAERGEMTIVMLYPNESDERWESKVATMPTWWISGTMPDADEYFDLTFIPSYLLLDDSKKVMTKDLTVEQILAAAANVNMRKK